MSGIIDNFLIIGVQAGILVIVIAIFRFLLRKRSKLFVYAMWLILLLRLCVPVTTESRWGIIDRQKPISVDKEYSSDGEGQWQDMYQSDLGSNMVSTTVKQPVSLKDQLEKWESVQKEEIKEGDSSIKFKKEEIVLLAWGMGVVVLLVISIVQYGQFIRKTRFAIKVEDNVWETENISTAFVTGFFRARIYLPTGLLEREREFILQHERVHIKHKDNIIRLIMLVVNIIYWWNPFVWLAIFMMKKDMEMFCDEVVVSALKDVERKEYLNVLLDNSAKISGIIPVMSFGESNTKMRIAHIVNLKKSGAMAVFIMICFGIICLTGCTTIAKHQNVSDSAVFTTEETTTEEEATTVKPGDEISTEPIVYVPQEGIYVSENPDSTILIYVDYFGAQIWDVSKLDGGHEPEYYLGRTDYPYYVREWDDNYAKILGITVLSDSLLMYEGDKYTHQRTEIYESGYDINYTGYPQYDELIDKLLAIRLQSVTSHMDFSDKGFSTIWFYMSTFVHGGYYLIDLDNNGIPELLLGENGQQAWAGTIYEVYTIKDGKAVKLLNGGERGNSMLCMNNIICYEGSGSAFHNEWAFYKLSNGELVFETQE